ncbi:MAG: ABC transporter permease [Anaerolineae bacterium]
MTRYILRRAIEGLALLFIVSVILFFITNSIGDPISVLTDGTRPPLGEERDRIMRQLGLDQPTTVQYLFWLIGNDWTRIDADGDGDTDENIRGRRQGILRGDLGQSLSTREPALDRIVDRLPNTLLLMIPSYLLVLTLALIMGIYSALRPYSPLDSVLTTLALVGYSLPIFLVCMGLIYVFASTLRILPTAGMWDLSQPRDLGNLARHMILPVTSLVVVQVARYIRYIRAGVLEVLNDTYIRTARAKGLRERRVIGLHVLRPASLPLVTLIGLDLPVLLGGAVVTERIFAWPGLGALFIESLNRSDYPVLMGILMFISVMVIVFQLLTDIVYTWLDPRITYGARG